MISVWHRNVECIIDRNRVVKMNFQNIFSKRMTAVETHAVDIKSKFLSIIFIVVTVIRQISTRVFSGGVQPKKIVQMVSQCHHPTICPLIPKQCSVKSEH